MTNRMGCQASDKVAAIATVSGTIGSALNCQPVHDVPVVHFHGTQDPTISYHSNPYGKSAVPNVNYWANINDCDAEPEMFPIPDVKDDGRTIEHYVYNNCLQGDQVHFYKVIGGTHQWLNATNNDISYNHVIWEFLSRWRRGGIPSQVPVRHVLNGEISIYPTPGKGAEVYVDLSRLEQAPLERAEWVDALGRVLLLTELKDYSSGTLQLSAPEVPGWYVLRLTASDGRMVIGKWVKH